MGLSSFADTLVFSVSPIPIKQCVNKDVPYTVQRQELKSNYLLINYQNEDLVCVSTDRQALHSQVCQQP